jgi:hypothetical protein
VWPSGHINRRRLGKLVFPLPAAKGSGHTADGGILVARARFGNELSALFIEQIDRSAPRNADRNPQSCLNVSHARAAFAEDGQRPSAIAICYGQNCRFGAISYTPSLGATPSARQTTSDFAQARRRTGDTGRTPTVRFPPEFRRLGLFRQIACDFCLCDADQGLLSAQSGFESSDVFVH